MTKNIIQLYYKQKKDIQELYEENDDLNQRRWDTGTYIICAENLMQKDSKENSLCSCSLVHLKWHPPTPLPPEKNPKTNQQKPQQP